MPERMRTAPDTGDVEFLADGAEVALEIPVGDPRSVPSSKHQVVLLF